MLQRTKKQIAYGTGFAAVLMGIIVLLGNASLRNQHPEDAPAPISSFLPIKLEALDSIQHIELPGVEHTIDIVARLRNPNAGAGVSKYIVTFSVKDRAGQEIRRVPVETYILPGAIQYAMALNVPIGGTQVASIEADLPVSPTFIPLGGSQTPPSFSAFARERKSSTVGQVTSDEQTGIVKNTSTFAWEKVEVYVVGINSESRVIAAGKTFLGALTVGEEREFTVAWPQPDELIERIIILPSTNMFQEQNAIRAIGNPGLLQ
ncbi:MAG: hypothetical protein HYZ63_01930 [Candidatus Andersenbacteria bacterium]|nr:hypothetical protein [Candidatus Andersenbacteria bacterium]